MRLERKCKHPKDISMVNQDTFNISLEFVFIKIVVAAINCLSYLQTYSCYAFGTVEAIEKAYEII
jgi:hypothetical protein